MATNPAAGWYQDPQDFTGLRYWEGNSWTEHTHRWEGAEAAPTEPKKRWRESRAANIIAIVGFIVLASAAGQRFASSDGGADPVASTEAAVTPAGWTATESDSGAITYAYPKNFMNAYDLMDAATVDSALEDPPPGGSSEWSGIWIDTSPASAGSQLTFVTSAGIVSKSHRDRELAAFVEAASGEAGSVGSNSYEEYFTSVGYRAASMDYTFVTAGITWFGFASLVVDGDNAVFVAVSSNVDPATARTLDKQAVDSLVINHAP